MNTKLFCTLTRLGMPPPTSIPYTPTIQHVSCTSMDHQLKCVVDTMIFMGGGRGNYRPKESKKKLQWPLLKNVGANSLIPVH